LPASQRGTLFFNPSSGAKLSGAELQALQDAATAAGLEVIQLTHEVNVSETIRARMQRGVNLFVAAGGDGTINHVIQPLINAEGATLGVIPVGTYNHFAKDVGIPLPWREALDVIVNGTTRQVDAARVNERFFVNNVSLGLYPELVARREAKGRDYPRWKARLLAAWATLRKFRHVSLTLESEHREEVIRTHMLMVSNNPYDLSRIGIEAPRTTLSEGRLSIYWLPHMPRLALMKFVAHFLAGRVRTAPGFRSFRASQLRLQSRKRSLPIGIDGEVMMVQSPMVITIVPQGLLVKAPRERGLNSLSS